MDSPLNIGLQEHSRFPARVYADTVLRVNFRDAQDNFLELLLQIHYAHTIMLARQRIIPANVALRCLEGLDQLDRAQLAAAPYDGQCEDLFFYVEKALELICGTGNAGHMHTARSRNDLDIALYRMRLRAAILEIVIHLNAVRKALVAIAKDHVQTVMPAYTHTQPAQPITLAHYLVAVIEIMGRDERRLQAAFGTVNRSPMGACAISTTGFPIDREFTAALLGFDGLQLNSYGAIAATDYLTETAGAIATAMVNLGRVMQDFLLWSTAEFGYLRLSDAWVQISSIMPQKRNPVPFEHVRVLASKAMAQAQGIFTALHNTPFGDINDAEDDLQPLVSGSTSDAARALKLFGGVLGGCQVNVARMAQRAGSDFLAVTELADTLVRREAVSFREAHGLVSAAVKSLDGNYSDIRMAEAVTALAPGSLGRPLRTSRVDLLLSLDPVNFVNIRGIPGGPAPDAVLSQLSQAEGDIALTAGWIEQRTALMAEYPQRIQDARSTVFV
jgi:argininosuccinate lyase